MSELELVAHRGYARHFPENTLRSVAAAIEAGARAVEIDVQLSRDRVPFLMHDRTLERMCGVEGALGQRLAVELELMHAAEREKFGAKFSDERLASLASFARLVAAAPGVHAFVELKRVSIEQFGADAVLDAVVPRLEPLRERCTLISFDVEVLARARQKLGHRVGPVLITWGQLATDEIASLRPDVVFCDVEKLPASGVLRAPGDLAVYEVDDPSLARELHRRGARYIETFAVGEMLRGLA